MFPALAGGLLLAALMAGGIFLALAWAANDEEPSQSDSPGQVTVTEEVTVDGEPTTVVQTVTTAPEPTTTPTDTAPSTQPQSDLTPTEAAALNDEAFVEHMQQGDYEGALPLLELAVPALQGTYSAGFRYEAYAEYNLGKTLAELDRCDEALPHLERSEQLQGERQPITAAKQQCGD